MCESPRCVSCARVRSPSAPTARSRCTRTEIRSGSCRCAYGRWRARSGACPRDAAGAAFGSRRSARPSRRSPWPCPLDQTPEGSRWRACSRRKLALARAVGALSRLRGGGATSAPGKLLLALEPDALGVLASRLTRGSVLVSATNGKTTTAAMAASILEQNGVAPVHNQAGANMAGGIASTLLSPLAHEDGSRASWACSRSTSCGWSRSPRSCTDARGAAGEPVPRPARPLRRARDDRRQLDVSAARWAGADAAAPLERRRPASSRTSGATADGSRCTSVSTTTRSRWRAWRTPPTPSTAAAAARLRVRCRLSRPPRPLPLPELRQRRPSPTLRATAVRLDGVRGARSG